MHALVVIRRAFPLHYRDARSQLISTESSSASLRCREFRHATIRSFGPAHRARCSTSSLQVKAVAVDAAVEQVVVAQRCSATS